MSLSSSLLSLMWRAEDRFDLGVLKLAALVTRGCKEEDKSQKDLGSGRRPSSWNSAPASRCWCRIHYATLPYFRQGQRRARREDECEGVEMKTRSHLSVPFHAAGARVFLPVRPRMQPAEPKVAPILGTVALSSTTHRPAGTPRRQRLSQ